MIRQRTITAILFVTLLASMAIAAPVPATAPSNTGRILCAYWREIPGTQIQDLTSLPACPNYPSEQVYLDRFAIPEDQEGNFGTVIRGCIHPPQSGSYGFYISGNNQCELWLSADANPDDKHLIASVPQWTMSGEWTAVPEQQSLPIQLRQGNTYYVEARHKNGGGDNHLEVAWKLPDGTFQGPIPGEFLSPALPVAVPPPVVSLPALPTSAGRYRVEGQVEYLTQRTAVPVLITVPPEYSAAGRYPAIIFLPDVEQAPDPDGFYVQGPNQLPPGRSPLGAICISPQPAAGHSYTQRTTMKAIAAVVSEICSRYPVDRRRIGLTGQASGGTAVWQLAMEMPGFYAALAPVNGRELRDPQLPDLLRGVEIRIYTDISEGFVTGCANRMSEALASLQPKPQVIYLGEKELGKRSADDYCYTEPTFYAHLLRADLTQPQITPSNRAHGRLIVTGILLAGGIAAGVYLYRLRRRGTAG